MKSFQCADLSLAYDFRNPKNVAEVLCMSGDESDKNEVRTINWEKQLEMVTAVGLFHLTECNFYYSHLQDARTPQV